MSSYYSYTVILRFLSFVRNDKISPVYYLYSSNIQHSN
nr:MAG TPA: hypothetical protein [Caudoviricetes sp.]